MNNTLKKMRLVPIDDKEKQINKSDVILNSLLFETSPNLKKVSELDNNLNDVLELNLSEKEKFDLYTQILRNFLFFRNKSKEESENLKLNNHNISSNQQFSQLSSTPINISKSSKTLGQPNISNIFNPHSSQSTLFSTPQQTLSINTPKSNRLSIIKKQRINKKKAESRIKKILAEKSPSSDEDQDTNWVPYNAAKQYKTIKKIKSK